MKCMNKAQRKREVVIIFELVSESSKGSETGFISERKDAGYKEFSMLLLWEKGLPVCKEKGRVLEGGAEGKWREVEGLARLYVYPQGGDNQCKSSPRTIKPSEQLTGKTAGAVHRGRSEQRCQTEDKDIHRHDRLHVLNIESQPYCTRTATATTLTPSTTQPRWLYLAQDFSSQGPVIFSNATRHVKSGLSSQI